MTSVRTIQKKAFRVEPADIIHVPGLGYRLVTESEYNVQDGTVVFSSENVPVLEVPAGQLINTYGTLLPPPDPYAPRASLMTKVAFLMLVAFVALVVGSVTLLP